ncbi:MAG TPA: TolC family protein [Terriglobales bacterium]|nr:TolC family protein [Terriglobales bacterium]
MQSKGVISLGRQLACLGLAVILSSVIWAQEPGQQQGSVPANQQQAEGQPATSSQPVETPRPQRFQLENYTKAKGYFPNPIGPYTSRNVPPPDLSNTPRIEQLLQNGKLMLSIDDAVALALENNLDIAIQRYNRSIADTDILRAKAGSTILGINAGIVQNTPGGTSGGIGGGLVGTGPGGTSAGSAGAGAGFAGLVSTTLGLGPNITSFDPVLSGTLLLDHNRIQCTSPFCGSVQNTGSANFSYLQGFHWGTNLALSFNNSRVTTNSPFTTFSPTLNSNFRFELTQHVLQGLGFAPNTRFIRIAKNDREISDVVFRLQTITTVDQIENMYWDLVFAYENVRVAQESVAFAQKTLSDTQKQVQIGTLAPIEVVRAQSTVATDQQQLTVAANNLELQQLLMKNALSRTLVDPRLADAEVIPISTMQLPTQEPVIPVQDLVNDALTHRPELAEARINLSNQSISNKAIRNALLPSLDLFAYYGGSGIGGAQNPTSTCGNPGAPRTFCTPPGTFQTTSYGATLNNLVDSTAPDKGFGATLTIPIRNRAAQAVQVRSDLEYRQAQMRLQQVENLVRIEVRNAQFSVQSNRASVNSAQAAVELAKQSLEAEQKKYALGASTSTLVLQNQTSLAQAQSTLVSAMAAYEKSRVELDRATGLLLDHAGILIADAEKGAVTRMPTIPYAAPRPNPAPVISNQPQQTAPQAQPAPPQQPQQEQQPQAQQPATPPGR